MYMYMHGVCNSTMKVKLKNPQDYSSDLLSFGYARFTCSAVWSGAENKVFGSEECSSFSAYDLTTAYHQQHIMDERREY